MTLDEHYLRIGHQIRQLQNVYFAALTVSDECQGGRTAPSLGSLAKLQSALNLAFYATTDGHHCADSETCTLPFSWDDGVPYCDRCGTFRANEARRAR